MNKKRFFREEFNESSKKYFQEWFIDRKTSFSLIDIYWAYVTAFLEIKTNDENIREEWLNPNSHEKFLLYLEGLLKEGKVKMKIIDALKEIKEENGINYNSYTHISFKEFNNKNSEEGIKNLKKKWFIIKNEKERRHFEDTLVIFSLPENEFLY